jgi:DNA-directed RNA polymerase specialized sigma24 family protein
VLYLVEVEDLSYAEVSALLEITEEAARARASRARRRLRLELTEEMDEGEIVGDERHQGGTDNG